MDKQIIEISNDGFNISLHRGFLVVENKATNIKREIPLDNILSLIISANQLSLTNKIINEICNNGGTLIFCDNHYLPNAITLPYSGHWLISSRIKQQVDISLPLKKNLWKSIVQHKISNQAKTLQYFFPDNPDIERLKRLSIETLSDDKSNNEGQAASIYFKALFGKKFVRDRLSQGVNLLLNYAYTILRAMVARAVAGNGILPYLGLKHCNCTDTFPLVDDLMEPFRAIADKIVYDIIMKNGKDVELTPDIKRQITSIVVYPIHGEKGKTLLSIAIYDFVTTLVKSYEEKKNILKFPCIFP